MADAQDDRPGIDAPPLSQESDADFVLRLEAYEGPIHLLLDQAREQKVDLAQISILALADQYLGFVERAHRLRLDLAADYLVMAAWLAYLKSRLLLPVREDDEDEPSGEDMAAALAFQLRRLESMRQTGEALVARPRLGLEVFARGAPDPDLVVHANVYDLSLYQLLKAYADHKRRQQRGAGGLQIQASKLYSIDQALHRLRDLLGRIPGWTTLAAFLPPGLVEPLVMRSAVAAHFVAALEMTKEGKAELRQDGPFQPIFVRQRQEGGG